MYVKYLKSILLILSLILWGFSLCYAETRGKVFFSGDGVSITQKDIDAENDMLSSNFDTSLDEKLRVILMERLFKLEYEKISNDALLEKKIQRMTEKYLALLYKKKISEELKISDEVVKSYYLANPEKVTDPEKYNLQMLMVPHKAICDKIYSDIINKIRSFETAVSEESIDEETSSKGGSLGWVIQQKMPREFVENIKGLTPGGVSPSFRYNGKWVLLKLADYKPPEKKKYDDVKDAIRATLTRKHLLKEINAEFERLKIKYKIEAMDLM